MTQTRTKENGVSEMIDLRQALVADHISDLEREGAALRAERSRGAWSSPGGGELGPPSRRMRLGRWLIGVGQAIAGPPAPAGRVLAASDRAADDDVDVLSPAA